MLTTTTATVNREGLLNTVYAEAGSEWQGSWVNAISQLADQELENVIKTFALKNNLLDAESTGENRKLLVLKAEPRSHLVLNLMSNVGTKKWNCFV
ncbi:MAG: hypothetical protein ABIR24_10925 [Verrucomicrobiota bacterium]